MNNLLLTVLIFVCSDFSAKGRFNLTPEYDSNIYKRAYNSDEEIIPDLDLRLQLDLSLKILSGRHLARVNLLNGGKLFIHETDANTLVNHIDLSYIYRKGKFNPEVGIELKDISTVDTIQDYTLLRPYLNLNIKNDLLLFKLTSGYEKFIFDFKMDYSYNAPFLGFLTHIGLDEVISIDLNYIFKYELFNSLAYKRSGNLDSDSLLTVRTTDKRKDINHNVMLRMNYEDDILISIAYNPEINNSNSAGESVFRQRFQLSIASQILYDIYLNILLSFMISSFKDGILISDQILLVNDNENRNYIIIKLSREILRKLMFEIRYSYYYSEFSNYITRFSRYILAAGICLKF